MRASTSIVAFALILVVLALAPARAQAQQFETKEEYDAYMALYNEADPVAKTDLGEAFVEDYPDSEATPIAYQLLVATYYTQRDWRSLLEAAKRFDSAFPDAADETRSFIYTRAMAAAQQENAPLDILDFGDKILELDRNNLGALLTLPPVILDNLPDFGSARERNLARAFELANRARVRAQSAFPISGGDPQQDAQRVQVFSRIYLYLGQVHELRGDDSRAVTEYGRILEYDSRNSDAYLRLGLAHQRLAAEQSADLRAETVESGPPVEAEGGAEPEAPELTPEELAIQQAAFQSLEMAIDNLASAAALGGQAAGLANRALNDLVSGQDPATWAPSCATDSTGLLCRMSPADAIQDENGEDLPSGEGLTVEQVVEEKRRTLN